MPFLKRSSAAILALLMALSCALTALAEPEEAFVSVETAFVDVDLPGEALEDATPEEGEACDSIEAPEDLEYMLEPEMNLLEDDVPDGDDLNGENDPSNDENALPSNVEGEPHDAPSDPVADGENSDDTELPMVPDVPEPAPQPPAIRLAGSMTIGIKETRALGPEVVGSFDGSPAFTYTSSNRKIFTVSGSGAITGKKAGKAVVTVSVPGLAPVKCTVRVVKAPKSVKLPKRLILGYDAASGTGSSARLLAKVSKGSASAITWSGYDQSILSMAADGTVSALAIGETRVTARTFNGKQSSCLVTVLPSADSVRLNIPERALGGGDSFALTASVPAGRFAGLRFASTSPEIARVDAAGCVRGLSEGDAEIVVTAFGGAEARCLVHVLPAPDRIAVDFASRTMGVKETALLNARPVRSDERPTAATLRYKSSNHKVVKVDGAGKLTARKTGKAKITITSTSGLTAQVNIKVVKAPKGLKLSPKAITLGYDAIQDIGSAVRLTPKTIKGASGIRYSGYNTAVVRVDANGTVTATGIGKTKITASTFNGKKASCTVTVLPAPEDFEFPSALTLWKGQVGTTVARLPRGTYPAVSYASDHPEIATVDARGHVVSRHAGSAVITATLFNGVQRSCQLTVTPYHDAHPLFVVAHRGGAGYRPENTLAAFENAISSGVDSIELDVQTTLDGVQVVHHDKTIVANGKQYAIPKFKYARLKALDPSLCTLKQALDLIAPSGVTLQLELKKSANEAACVKIVKSCGMSDRTTYISFRTAQLSKVRKADRHASIGLIVSKLPKNIIRTASQLRLDVISFKDTFLNREPLVDELHRAGFKVCFWTLNEPGEIARAREIGADYICGDYPDLIAP